VEYLELYNDIFFESRPSPERHVLTLSTLAFLNGLSTPPASESRVLEIGCSTGGNLIPMACAFPEASFLGIDISSSQIKSACKKVSTLELKNIRFIEGDVRQEEPLEGNFDYIICHGMLTWVDPGIQDALLAFIAKNLTPEGVCYLSFNSQPGWRTRQIIWNALAPVRSMICSVQEKTARAKALLRSMSAMLIDTHRPYGIQLKEEIDRNLERSNAFFAHEILNPFCSALTLSELRALLKNYQLHYLCDAEPFRSPGVWAAFPELEQEFNKNIAAPPCQNVNPEQMADFLFPQSFRGAIISKKKAAPGLRQNPELIDSLSLCSPIMPLEVQPDIFSTKAVTFCSPTEQTREESDPLVKSALLVMRKTWPEPIHFKELYATALELSGLEPDTEQLVQLRLTLMHYFQSKHLELYREGYRAAIHHSDNPKLFSFARSQSLTQDWVTTLRHETMPVDQFDKFLMPLLNGENSRATIAERMSALLQNGALQAKSDGQEVSSPDELEQILNDEIEHRLKRYIEQALLV